MLAEPDDGDRVERFGLETGIGHDHAGSGRELVVGHGLDQGQGDPLGDRGLGGLIHLDGDHAGLGDGLEMSL